ncbi:MAG: type II toxin-antitoxin system HicA family toxin [Chloroflexi bacterium]|nr:type II toxin-antitoxin system HicA family toxin [Chloroflexota bacterium]
MTYRQLSRKLRALGCEFDRQARGSHVLWRNPATGTKASIPDWGSKDLKAGTISAILRDLRISRSDFERS